MTSVCADGLPSHAGGGRMPNWKLLLTMSVPSLVSSSTINFGQLK
jgi:hypothetical protein